MTFVSFLINAQNVIYSPSSGQTFTNGQTINITWNLNSTSPVTIIIRKNDNSGWGQTTIAENISDNGSFSWKIPNCDERPFSIVREDDELEILINSSGSSAKTGGFKVYNPKPNTPTNFRVIESETTQSSVRVKMNVPDNCFNTNFSIFNCDTNTEISTTSRGSSNATEASTTLYNLTPNTNYRFKVKAYNNSGSSSFSSCIQVKTLAEIPTKPVKPSGQEIIFKGAKEIAYQTEELNNVSSYKWELTPSNSGVINGNSNEIKIDWDDNYIGASTLSVKGVNSDGVSGEESDALSINVRERSTIFNDISFYSQGVTPNTENPSNYLNKNQPIRFKVKIENELSSSLSTLQGTLTSGTAGVTITDNTVSFGNIASETYGWSSDEFEIEVADSVASGTLLEFQLETQDQVVSGGPWVSSFSFPIEPLSNGNLIVVDSNGDNDNVADPGETVKLFPKIDNVSTVAIANVSGILTTEDPITLTDYNNDYNVVSNTQTPISSSDTEILPEFPFEFNYPNSADFQELNFDLELQGNLNDNDGVLLKWKNTLVLNEGEDPVLPPTITGYTPLNNAIDVAVNTDLVLEFDKNITAVSGKFIKIYKSDNTLIHSTEANDAIVTINNNQLTLDVSSDLNGGINYYILIDEGAFIDENNTAYKGITDISTWSFTTIQNDPPNAPVVSVSTITDSEITMNWDAVDTAESYQILSCNGSVVYETSTTATSYTASNLTSETSYNFIVKAKNDIGYSVASNCVTAETLCSYSWGSPIVSGGNSTTAYCIVTIDNQPASENDLVGAFVGTELRGLGTIVLSSGTAYSTIVIDGSVAETVTFKVWIADDCEELSVNYSTETNLGEIGFPPNYLPINASNATASVDTVKSLSDSFLIYPNPTNSTNSILRIEKRKGEKINSIEVFNVLGEKIKEKFADYEVLDISKFAKGVYFLKIKTNKGAVTKKIIKE